MSERVYAKYSESARKEKNKVICKQAGRRSAIFDFLPKNSSAVNKKLWTLASLLLAAALTSLGPLPYPRHFHIVFQSMEPFVCLFVCFL